MKLAIAKAKEGILHGDTAFGSCFVRDGKVLSIVHNTAIGGHDATAHAEVNAIRAACKRPKKMELSDSTLYTTCEPCPMCFTACTFANVQIVVTGARHEDVGQYGVREVVSPKMMNELAHNPMEIIGDVLREECIGLFELWSSKRPGVRRD